MRREGRMRKKYHYLTLSDSAICCILRRQRNIVREDRSKEQAQVTRGKRESERTSLRPSLPSLEWDPSLTSPCLGVPVYLPSFTASSVQACLGGLLKFYRYLVPPEATPRCHLTALPCQSEADESTEPSVNIMLFIWVR